MYGKPDSPKISAIGSQNVSISFAPPASADTSKLIIYLIKYRKAGETEWQSVPDTSSRSVTVNKLHSCTHYEITVAAKYQTGQFGPASDPLKVKTKCGKCLFKDGLHWWSGIIIIIIIINVIYMAQIRTDAANAPCRAYVIRKKVFSRVGLRNTDSDMSSRSICRMGPKTAPFFIAITVNQFSSFFCTKLIGNLHLQGVPFIPRHHIFDKIRQSGRYRKAWYFVTMWRGLFWYV